MKETDLQRQVLDYLAWKRIFAYRNNSGAFAGEYKGRKRFIRFSAVGSLDIICVVDGLYVGLELKAPRGKQSDRQQAFQHQLEEAGGVFVLAHSLEDVIRALEDIHRTALVSARAHSPS